MASEKEKMQLFKTIGAAFFAVGLVCVELLASGCGAEADGGQGQIATVETDSQHSQTVWTQEGDVLTRTIYDFIPGQPDEIGGEAEALTVSPGFEGALTGKDANGNDLDGPCPPNAPLGFCGVPRDKITAFFNGIVNSQDTSGIGLRAHWDGSYGEAKAQLDAAGSGWNLATSATDTHSIGGDKVVLSATACDKGCIAKTEVLFLKSDCNAGSIQGTPYCEQAPSTGCVITVHMPNFNSIVSGVSAGRKATYAHNVFRHELGHCLGLPHRSGNTQIEVMVPSNLSFDTLLSYSANEIFAVKTLIP